MNQSLRQINLPLLHTFRSSLVSSKHFTKGKDTSSFRRHHLHSNWTKIALRGFPKCQISGSFLIWKTNKGFICPKPLTLHRTNRKDEQMSQEHIKLPVICSQIIFWSGKTPSQLNLLLNSYYAIKYYRIKQFRFRSILN